MRSHCPNGGFAETFPESERVIVGVVVRATVGVIAGANAHSSLALRIAQLVVDTWISALCETTL